MLDVPGLERYSSDPKRIRLEDQVATIPQPSTALAIPMKTGDPHNTAPSRVVHARAVPDGCTHQQMVAILQAYGRISWVCVFVLGKVYYCVGCSEKNYTFMRCSYLVRKYYNGHYPFVPAATLRWCLVCDRPWLSLRRLRKPWRVCSLVRCGVYHSLCCHGLYSPRPW